MDNENINNEENNIEQNEINQYSADIEQEQNSVIPQNKKITKNKKLKKKVKRNTKSINFGIGTFMLVVFCSFLLVIATFLQLDITHIIIPSKIFSGKPLVFDDFIYTIKYIPQIPIALFTVGLLGRRYGSMSIVLYIITGLFILPVFALGGGLRYILTYGFGYILAFLPAGIIMGSVLKNGYTYKNVAKAVFFGVITIHLFGIFYMAILAYINHAGVYFLRDWIISQSGIKVLYDFVFSYLFILVAKYLRIILWFYL